MDRYLASSARGKSVLIVSPTWREINAITTEVRTALKAAKCLAETDTPVEIHDPLNWTRAQKRDLRNYTKGMILKFHRHTEKARAGDCLSVARVGKDVITVVNRDGTEVSITGKQSGCFEVVTTKEISVAAGEVIRLRGNLKALRLFNGQSVTVRSVESNGAIRLTDGRVIPPKFGAFTHGYCCTSVAAQGRKFDHVLLAMDSHSLAVNQNQFYVGTSRGVEEIHVFSDDLDALRTLVKRSGSRKAALEFAQEVRENASVAVWNQPGIRIS